MWEVWKETTEIAVCGKHIVRDGKGKNEYFENDISDDDAENSCCFLYNLKRVKGPERLRHLATGRNEHVDLMKFIW